MPSMVNFMSRIGKKPILIPDGVEVKVDGSNVSVKGPKGDLSLDIRNEIAVQVKEGQIIATPKIHIKQTKAFLGLTRALVANMVKGVNQGYEKKLEINGIGYKANLEGKDLLLFLGFTNPVKIVCPEGITISVEKNIITISGIDKYLVGQIAATIRSKKKPEPYKGKGIKYLDEIIRRKAGKKATGTTG